MHFIYASVIAGHKTAENLIGLKWGGNNATNSHSNKDKFKLFGLDVLTIIKFVCIILLMLLSSWITYNIAENKYNKERLEISRAEI